jgi:outer membrane lipoprotein LolB
MLQACTGIGTRQPGAGDEAAYRERAARIAAFEHWGFNGKLSLDDGEQGGSGSLRWNSGPASTALDFRGTMGRGAWQLLITPTEAVLTEADGSVRVAPNVEALVLERIGWAMPVDALAWWVRGLQAPGDVDVAAFDADGRLLRLKQFDWEIEFTRYRDYGGEVLPAKLEARRDAYRVKLAAGRWQLGTDDGG